LSSRSLRADLLHNWRERINTHRKNHQTEDEQSHRNPVAHHTVIRQDPVWAMQATCCRELRASSDLAV